MKARRFDLRGLKAFSLIELLVVITIMGILAWLCAPAIVSLISSDRASQTFSTVVGILGRARQYAISNNTYSWVAFYQGSDASGSILYVADLISKDGTDPSNGFTVTGTIPANNYVMLDKISSFSQISLQGAGVNTWASLPSLTATASNLASNIYFSMSLPGNAAAGTVTFTNVIQFNSAGEARVSPGLVSCIEFGLSPTNSSGALQNNAVVRIAGMTGVAQLYRH